MGKSFRVSVYTPQDISLPQTAQLLWRLLSDPLIDPQRFDTVERAKINFTSEGYDKASEIFGAEGMLFVRGSKDSFTAMFMRQHGGWGMWNFWWDVKAMMQQKRDPWLQWLFKLCRELPPFYGFGCSVDEYDAKHTVVEDVPGGSVTRTVGASAREFYEFLPGLYWMTIFGTHLVDHFGARLESLDRANFIKLNSSQAAVVLDEPVVPQDIDERLRIESQLIDSLGAKYFFDCLRLDVSHEAVPELVAALRDLKS